MARKYGMTNGILILSHKIRQLLYLRLLQFATFVDSSQSTIVLPNTLITYSLVINRTLR